MVKVEDEGPGGGIVGQKCMAGLVPYCDDLECWAKEPM